MGKYGTLDSPEKSLQYKRLSDSAQLGQDSKQNATIPKNKSGTTHVPVKDGNKEKEQIYGSRDQIENLNANGDHENNSGTKQIVSHASNKKKKRRNKTKTKNNKAKTNPDVAMGHKYESQTRNDNLEENTSKLGLSSVAGKVSAVRSNGGIPQLTPQDNLSNDIPTLNTNLKVQSSSINSSHLQIANLSPRKQSILRYKKSDDRINERSLINEAKENLKNKKKLAHTPESQYSDKVDDSLLAERAELDMDKKVSLFRYRSSRILVFDEQHNDTNKDKSHSSGRLLGHGEFEIFQLHNGDVTYLSCGPSFVYPLLPKIKLLRINFNQFILPLVNPERYWKIFINSEERQIIELLERTLQKTVKYRNLYFGKSSLQPLNHSDIIKEVDDDKATKHNDTANVDGDGRHNNASGTNTNTVPRFDSIPDKVNDFHSEGAMNYQFPVIFNEIPDSPPSAPLSPHNPDKIQSLNLLTPTKTSELLPGWSIPKKTLELSITSAIASLDVRDKEATASPRANHSHSKNFNLSGSRKQPSPLPSQKILQPKAKRYNNTLHQHSNPFQDKLKYTSHNDYLENKSDSSMDSLLDEYEENISTTKSINFNNSRPPSRQMSITSSYSRPQINYTRGTYFHGAIEKEVDEKTNSHYNENFDHQNFPTTSLSEYNKIRNSRGNNVNHGRSRRSSRSELYTSESNWMEPNISKLNAPNRKPQSRHSFNMQGANLDRPRMSADVKQIYRSVTQRNLSQYTNDLRANDDTKSVMSTTQAPKPAFNPIKIRSPATNTLHRKGSYASSILSGRTGNESVSRYNGINELPRSISTRQNMDQQRLANVNMKLNSSDVYKMISTSRSNKNLNAAAHGFNDINEHQPRDKPDKRSGFASRLFGW